MAYLSIYGRFKVFEYLNTTKIWKYFRPAPQTARRPVPEKIPRPDYALHPEGVSLAEKNSRSTGQILVKD